MITELTAEQKKLIPVYQEKYKQAALCTEPIDRQKAADAVKAAYGAIGIKEPEIRFFDSPYSALTFLLSSQGKHLRKSMGCKLGRSLKNHLHAQLNVFLYSQLADSVNKQLMSRLDNLWMQLLWDKHGQLINQLELQLKSPLPSKVRRQVSRKLNNCIQLEEWNVSFIDCQFLIEVLECDYSQTNWEVSKLLAENCDWIFPYQNICFACDRPIKISIDNQIRLHAEAEPALQFADGYELYSHHGVTLPEKYGKIHPEHWQAKWILEEENAEVRRALIQGIGYTRICQELQAVELDTWQDYHLLKIDDNLDIEPIYMLKMTCPSTGFIHALRVPPNLGSAREAIGWVNWEIDPEEFAIQS